MQRIVLNPNSAWLYAATPLCALMLAMTVQPGKAEISDVDGKPDNAWFRCSSDDDCTTVLGFCSWEAVNKMHGESLRSFIVKKYNLDVKLYKCPQEFEDAPQPRAACIQQQCVIPQEN